MGHLQSNSGEPTAAPAQTQIRFQVLKIECTFLYFLFSNNFFLLYFVCLSLSVKSLLSLFLPKMFS